MKVLVTGGAGFLGSHLCDRLIADGHEVYCLDNLYTGRLENVATLRTESRFHFIEQDVCEPYDVEVQQIYNLACPASPVHYQREPVRTSKTCFLGALNALELARRRGARVLQSSTSEIYGDPDVHPQTEAYHGNVSCTGIRACYDEGKRVAESLFFDYKRQHGVDIRIARIFNTYGPRMAPDDGRVVSNFVLQALRGKPMTIHGEGKQTRSFCHVDDMVEGLIRLMAYEGGAPVINLGNPVELSIGELAHLVQEMVGARAQVVRAPDAPDDPRRRRPDITLARKELGWEPKVTLRAGLERTIDYFRRTNP